ncbi:hypothetical protein C1D09_018560 [Mesorhizobium intechi]|uniref:Uncharacterized protein n=2 Tax=Mesorhizobium intechi TaxID=537601 RepID=A0A8T9AMT7_9HYPH|nr:hypothetical protein C1D09_018560 [Mesorhizobium intechi]
MTRGLMATMVLGSLAISAGADQAHAAGQCAPRADLIKALGEKFHENEAGRGLINSSVVLEVFVSQQGSWTVVASDTTGRSCVLSAGEGWDSTMMKVALPGA